MTRTALQEFVRLHGSSLDCVGLTELALRREDALHAIRIARESGIALLGGDVWSRASGRIAPAYANGYCKRAEGESPKAHSDRSCTELEAYVRGYPVRAGEESLFVLVV